MSTEADRLVDERIAGRLPTAWSPFFARHGRLRPVQRLAMPEILDGRDVLVIAPTASGKTEAACAPLVERYIDHPPWTVLYVSPTRALVNDLHERLAGPTSQLGLTIRRRTGDHREALDAGANLLLTTPESFDSLICRGRQAGGKHVLGDVRAVVLDEIHLVHGTARGEQLRWLLGRLRRIRRQIDLDRGASVATPQVVALSATVPDPAAIADAFLGPDAFIARASGSREIEVVSAEVELPDTESAVTAYVRSVAGPQKILVFSNARKRVDGLARSLAEGLAPDRIEVRAHHGSLSRDEREDTERALKQQPRIIVCATMTLEIGIDIGDVDLVVLDGPAPSVSSLLQRVGRGNRRSGKTRVMPCSGSLVEPLIHAAMLDAARRGDLGAPDHGPNYAVARQQLASYLFQSPTRSRPVAQLTGLIAELLPEIDAGGLVTHLITTSDLEEDASGVRLGEEWLESTVRGDIHSNIEDAGGYQVVDERTGGLIGSGIRTQSGRGLGVAGKLLEVKSWQEFQIVVQRASTSDAAVGDWSYVSRGWMRGAGQPEAVRQYLGIPDGTWPVIASDGHWCVFHLGGARRKAVLDLIARFAGEPGLVKADEWCLRFRSDTWDCDGPPRWLTHWTPAQLALLLTGDNLARMERLLARPSANRRLPSSLRVREVTAWLRLEEEQRAFSAMRWSPAPDSEQLTALQLIAGTLGRQTQPSGASM